jgi:hypothetical protein
VSFCWEVSRSGPIVLLKLQRKTEEGVYSSGLRHGSMNFDFQGVERWIVFTPLNVNVFLTTFEIPL